MNTLHHCRFVSAVQTTGGPLQPATRLLGYVDINQQMAAKYGRQMSPLGTFDLVAYRADIQLQDIGAGANSGIGASMQGNINYVSPGKTRVRALLEARERWHQEMLETDTNLGGAQLSRDRQFYPKYDEEMPTTPYYSLTETAGSVTHTMVMIDRGTVGLHWGIFKDWNARNPRWPAPTVTEDGLVPADPRLYVFPASEIEEVLGFRAYSTAGAASQDIGNLFTTHVASGAEWNVAPAGRAWPILMGYLRIEIDEITPSASLLGVQDATSFVVIMDFYVSGWRTIQPKGMRSSRRR